MAIENYDEDFDDTIPDKPYRALTWGFDWDKSPQGNEYWNDIDNQLRKETYNFKIEPMEQQSELDYMKNIIQAKEEGKKLRIRPRGSKDETQWDDYTSTSYFNFIDWEIDIKPEPPSPKTEKFTFADADFLLGLKIRIPNTDSIGIIVSVGYDGICVGKKFVGWSEEQYISTLEYKCPKTEEWKPFSKVIE